MPVRDYAIPQSSICRKLNGRSSDRISFRRRTRLQDVTDHDPEPETKPEQTSKNEEEISAAELKESQLERLFPPSVAGYETFEMEASTEPSVSSF